MVVLRYSIKVLRVLRVGRKIIAQIGVGLFWVIPGGTESISHTKGILLQHKNGNKNQIKITFLNLDKLIMLCRLLMLPMKRLRSLPNNYSDFSGFYLKGLLLIVNKSQL